MSTPKPLVFVFASCQYPAGLLDQGLSSDSYRRMAARLQQAGSPTAPIFLLGDQIYADATAGLADLKSWKDRYQHRYKDSLEPSSTAHDSRSVYTMLDDHEIDEGWEPHSRPDWQTYLDKGREAYLANNPRPPMPQGHTANQLWYHLIERGIPFFVADTRSEREHRTPTNVMQARIMSATQMSALKVWLQKSEPDKPKFIAMPAMPLPRRLATAGNPCDTWRSDAWDGYPASLHELLGFIAEQQIAHVVFLSGDEHLANICRITLTADGKDKKPINVLSLHAPALYAPFPFANSKEQDFKAHEQFPFNYTPAGNNAPLRVTCDVETQFPNNGDGFFVVTVNTQASGDWAINIEVNGRRGQRIWLGLITS